jgi:hypothetical protein
MFVDFNNISIKKNIKIEICNFVIIVREFEVKRSTFFLKNRYKKTFFFEIFEVNFFEKNIKFPIKINHKI